MDQKKVGMFLRVLRKEKNITQEQLAEKLNVSGRTVSSWETGVNMPDISLLVELSEFYRISIAEIIEFSQVPRFCYEKIYSGYDKCDRVEYKTLFYSVIQENPGTADENVKIVK